MQSSSGQGDNSVLAEPGQAEVSTHPAGLLVFDGVGKTFENGTCAFRDISFRLDEGEFVSIVGPSGCGKSSILRAASGLLQPSAGVLRRPDSDIGFVFQDATLLPWRSVRRNVELLLELDGVKDRDRLVDEALDLVGLTAFADHLPRQLSGGMRMRTSLARGLVLNPRLFLFDEPFGALDEITRERLQMELSRLFVARRFGGLFITHSVFEAVFLSTRVLVMSQQPGEITAEFDVPFATPRASELRFEPEFSALCAEVSAALKDSHR